MTLKLRQLGKQWWIVGGEKPIGPYDTRAEAEEDRRGLVRFERYKDTPGYITTETR